MNQIMKIFNQNFLLVFIICYCITRYPDFILNLDFGLLNQFILRHLILLKVLLQVLMQFLSILLCSFIKNFCFLASLVSLENAPLVHTLIGLFVILIPIIIIATSDLHLWKDIKTKVYLAAFLILSCSTGEIWLNSTNLGFIIPTYF